MPSEVHDRIADLARVATIFDVRSNVLLLFFLARSSFCLGVTGADGVSSVSQRHRPNSLQQLNDDPLDMNIVRGVASLLRRNSSSQHSDRILPEQRTRTSNVSPGWPEIRFRSDVEDERVLDSLWRVYVDVRKAESLAEAETALAAFLEYFLETYGRWVPADPFYQENQGSLSKEDHFLGCSFGHPTIVISFLIEELKSITKPLSELTDGADLSQLFIKRTEDLLHVFEIMNRSAHNRQLFRKYEGLHILVNLMKAAVVQLKRIVGTTTTKQSTVLSAGDVLAFLQVVLIHIVEIISLFINVEKASLSVEKSIESDSCLLSNEEIVEVKKKERIRTNESIPLMEMGGLNWFVELLRVVQKLQKSNFLVDSSLKQITLRTLKSALNANLRAQNHFKSLGGIDVVIDIIGLAPKEMCYYDDFQIQVLSLEALREAVFRNFSGLQYVFEIGGVEKFVNIMIWAAFIFPKLNLEKEQTGGNNLQGLNSEVSTLCKILCSFLIESGDICDIFVSSVCNYNALHLAGSYWELATRWVLKILLGIFRDLSSTQITRLQTTSMQHYVLYVCKKLLAATPWVRSQFSEEGYWEVMFSEHFFFFDMEDNAALDGKGFSNVEVLNSIGMIDNHHEEMIDYEPLRLEVISFVELAATANYDYDNSAECEALMVALEQCATIPNVASTIAKSLHRILQLAPDQTVHAFLKIKALMSLSQVMDMQLQEYSTRECETISSDVMNECDKSTIFLTTKDIWRLSRESVFNLFAEFVLASEEARIVALHSMKTLQVLFDLLWDPGSRKFALGHILDIMKLPPISEADQEAKLELCIKYLETLSQSGVDGKPKDINLLMDLLNGIHDVLVTDILYYQSLFQEAECFVHIVSLLNENFPEENGKILCLSVLQTLTHILSGNKSSKNAFRSLVGVGYATLQTLLLNSHQDSPTEELLSALLDMLVDGKFSMADNILIQNNDIIILFFSILCKCYEALQLFGLITFSQILDLTANKANCAKAGLLSILLDWFGSECNEKLITKLAILIEALGRHSITGKDMRKLFLLLRDVNQGSKPSKRRILLHMVQGMLNEEGPAVFFDLTGNGSGIVITSSLRWPTIKGFTFSCWMRVEAFPPIIEDNDVNGKSMTLFAFLTDAGKGYSAMIRPGKLIVETYSQKRESVVQNVQIKPKHWCHLAVTHSVGRALSGGGTLRVYVDGCLASSDKLRYPKFTEQLSRCTIGAISPLPSLEGFVDQGKFSFPFCGQLGPIYLFDDILSPDHIMTVYQAGPGYMYSFLSSEIGCVPVEISSNNIFDMKDGLSSKVIFGFNAQASSGRTIYDVSMKSNSATDKMPYEAAIMSGTQLCYRRMVKDIIDCVGGVGVFFPLLTQLDQPTPMMVLHEKEASDDSESLDILNVYDAAEVIELITSVLTNSFSHQQYMHQNKGMSIIGLLLRSVSPQHLTTTVTNALTHLLLVISKSTGDISRLLLEELLLKVFLDLNIWIYTPYAVQRDLLMALLNFCESDPASVQNYITLPKILDLIQQFYWDRPNRKALGTKRLSHPVTNELIGVRPSVEEVGKLRILLLSIAEVVVRDTISMSDVKAFLAFLEISDDALCMEDVLHMMIRLLTRKDILPVFVEDIQVLGGFQLLLGVLEREEESLRLLGIQVINLLLNSMAIEKKGSWLLTIATGVTRTLYDKNRVERMKLNPLFAAITERLIVFPFSDLLCAALFDVLLGGASLKQVLQRGAEPVRESVSQIGSTVSLKKNSLTSSQFVLPQVLAILMKFLLVSDDRKICCGVLKDLLRLLEADPSSSDAIVLEPLWQSWLFDLLIHIEDSKHQIKENEDIRVLEEEQMLIYCIFSLIHFHCTYRVKSGWRHVERTINFAHLYADKGPLSTSKLLHQILGDLLEALLQARSQESGHMQQPCRDNTLYVLMIFDELLIKDMIQLLPFAGAELIRDEAESPMSPERHLADIQYSTGSERRLIDNFSNIEESYWQVYDKFWVVLTDVYGKDKGDFAAPSLGQRARGLVESMNIPAAEMAAAVVAGGIGAVASMNPGKLIDKAIKLRGEKFPRVVCHMVLLYIYKASLETAASCINQFVSLLPLFLGNESEQCKNRLQLLLRCLFEARTQMALVDRFHLISQLIREIVVHAVKLLGVNVTEENGGINDIAAVQSLLEQDRVINTLKEEKEFLEASILERASEAHSLSAELKDDEEYNKSNRKFLEEQRQSSLNTICSNESLRVTAVHLEYEEYQQTVANHWCHMFRNLSDERGPWSTLSFPNDNVISWKLDRSEDPWRRRLKLKRNYHIYGPVIHTKNGLENISSSLPSWKVTTFDPLLGTSKVLLKGLRRISEEEIVDSLDDEKGSSENCKSVEMQESISVGSQEPVDIEDQGRQYSTGEEGITKHDYELDKVLHTSACVLVTPKRKLAGRLEITEGSIHFYGDFMVDGTAGSSVFTSAGQLNCNEHMGFKTLQKSASKKQIFMTGSDHVHLESGKISSKDESNMIQQSDILQGPKEIKRHRRWDISKVKTVYGRRYLLQHTALEIFFENATPPVFLNFPFQRNAKDVGVKVVSLRNSLLLRKGSSKEKIENNYFVDRRLSVELSERYRDQWRRREISNFEYLMHLNTLAGRSYNDFTQYPVFPWIISDYTSEFLDLNSPSSFRDLSKPVGALDAKRFEVFEERYHNFNDPDIPSFYYGSHYSSMGIVLFYLLRLEPFTSLHRSLQGGKFDHADRLFHSIEGTYRNCLTNTSDVKELIPEFFYMPDFLVNSNNFFMGVKQDGEIVDSVVLPPWAKGSPEEFIQRNREALESEYVSQHLHEWIDLIFGYKQRGRPAVEAVNVFYYLTYEGAVDLESLDDRIQRAAVEDQIANFGQTPTQLFRKKHPRRGAPVPISRPLHYAPASIIRTSSVPASMLMPSASDKEISLLFVGLVDSKVILVTNDLKIIARNWITTSQAGGNFTFSSSQEPFFGVGTDVSQMYSIRGHFAESVVLDSSCFQVLHVHESSYLLTCGHWDNSLRIISLTDGSLVQSNKQHKDVVSCLAVSSDGTIIVTGSNDTTVMVWEIEVPSVPGKKAGSKGVGNSERAGKWESILSETPRHVLSGHDDSVTCVAVSVELDLVASGSRDCSCIIHSLQKGRYVRSIRHPSGGSISKIAFSKHGRLVLFSNDDLVFLSYTVNGKLLTSSESNCRINCLEVSNCGEYLLCGGDQSQVILRSMYSLEVIRKYDGTSVPIISLSVTPEDCFLAATQDGSLLIYSIERMPQKKSSIMQTLRTRNT